MKIKSPYFALLCSLGFVNHGLGQVPSLINYQGRLADANGAPVTGSKNFTLSIYDGETEGGLLYSEDIGAVTLDDNGVYSFQFGAEGTSEGSASKLVGTTNGSSSVFNTVLPASAAGVSLITDGDFTWSPTDGSSSPTSFIGSYDSTSRTVSAIYIGNVPIQGTEITVSYTEQTDGIMGALAAGAQHWLELSIDGVTQAQRERVLSVPFAQVAGSSFKKLVRRNFLCSVGWWIDKNNDEGEFVNTPITQLGYQQNGKYFPNFDFSVKSVETITAKVRLGFDSIQQLTRGALKFVRHEALTNEVSVLAQFDLEGSVGAPYQLLKLNDSIPIDTENYSYFFTIEKSNGGLFELTGLKLSVMNAE